MNFDFSGRIQSAFGFKAAAAAAKIYLATDNFVDGVKNGHPQLSVDVFVSANEAVFDEIILSHGAEKYVFAYRSLNEQYADVYATPPMLSLKRAKKLIITSIDNSDIEVVERYGTEPWEITWRGLLIDMVNHNFPIDKMESLNKIFEANREWNVASEIMRKAGVEAIYIRDISIEFVEGYEDTIAYTLTTRAVRSQEVQISNQ
jgi:hypothetical protein